MLLLAEKAVRILKENDLRIYAEKYFPGIKKKPDIIIAQLRDEYEEKSLYASIREEDIVVLFEKAIGQGNRIYIDNKGEEKWTFVIINYLNC